jgi:hypothetical protein
MVSLGVERDSKSPSFHYVFFLASTPRVIAGGEALRSSVCSANAFPMLVRETPSAARIGTAHRAR